MKPKIVRVPADAPTIREAIDELDGDGEVHIEGDNLTLEGPGQIPSGVVIIFGPGYGSTITKHMLTACLSGFVFGLRVAIVLAMTCSAQAGFIESTGVAYTAVDVDPAAQVIEGKVLIAVAPTIIHNWIIPGLGEEDLGTVFTLDETTATSYGLDWEEIASQWLVTPEHPAFNVFTGISADGVQVPGLYDFGFMPVDILRRTGTSVLWIEYELTRDFVSPHDGTLLLKGEARVRFLAPEPASAGLLLFAFLGLCLHRLHHPIFRD